MAGLRIRNLSKSFGRNRVIKDISFEVKEGEFCILLGPSGCGKSTILRLIAGLERKDGGEIFIGGREVSGLSPRERDVAMVFQSYALYPHMTAFENIAFPLRMRKMPASEAKDRVIEIARLLGIEELLQRKPAGLSGGQRQRVALGRAIVREPAVFLFDEPLSNLDAKLRATMRIELSKLHRRLGTTMVYVTHDQVEAMTLGERIILLEEGRISQQGTPRELYEKPANLFVATFIGSPQINVLEGRMEGTERGISFECPGLSLDLGERKALLEYAGREVTAGIRPEALSPGNGPIRGEIEIVEHVGSEAYVYLTAPGLESRIVAKARPDFQGKPGEPISLLVDRGGVHFFSQGRRIEGE